MKANKEIRLRGILTDELLNNELLHYVPQFDTTSVVRLLPYLDYCLKNQGYIDVYKMTSIEVDMIEHFCDKKLIVIDGDRITSIDKQFYDFIQNVMYNAYVCIK